MKKSGQIRHVLVIFALVALLLVVVGGIRVLWVRNNNAIFDAMDAHDNTKVFKLLNSGVDPNTTMYYNTDYALSLNNYADAMGITDPRNRIGHTILSYACAELNVEVCKALLEKGANANLIPEGEASPPYYAIGGNNTNGTAEIVKIVNLLLEHHADVNESTWSSHRPLTQATMGGSDDVVKILIEHGAEVNYIGIDDGTALYFAAAYGYSGCVTMLLNAGADPTIRARDGDLPIDAASKKGHSEVVAILKVAMAKRKAVGSGASSTTKK